MRTTLLFAGLALAFTLPLTGCDSTGIDGETCQYNCVGGSNNGAGGGDGGDNGGGNGGDKASVTIDISPRQTYLRTSEDDAIDAPAISLRDLGYSAGEPVCFRTEGDYTIAGTYYATERGGTLLTAVFSSSQTLRSNSERYRVADAIEAGSDTFTLPTDRNGLVTDIDEDFDALDVCLTIPDGAEYVFFGAFDSFYGDNGSIDGTPFRVRIEK